jgi:DNA-binding NarL/FixJ family response regulator
LTGPSVTSKERGAEGMEQPTVGMVRLGLLSAESLRLVGLQAILADRQEFEVIPVSVPRALDTAGLEIVIIDAEVTEHLFELLTAFRRERPKIKLVVIGPEMEFSYVGRIIGAGVKGYLGYTASEAELKMALDVVLDGSVWAPRKVLARLLEQSRQDDEAKLQEAPSFTARERDVLNLLEQGHPNREIALALGVDEGAIKAHIGRLMRKVGVGNRTALTMRVVSR